MSKWFMILSSLTLLSWVVFLLLPSFYNHSEQKLDSIWEKTYSYFSLTSLLVVWSWLPLTFFSFSIDFLFFNFSQSQSPFQFHGDWNADTVSFSCQFAGIT